VISFEHKAITILLENEIQLESLNNSFYTWRNLATLEREEENRTVKAVIQLVVRSTIAKVPVANCGIFSASVVIDAKYLYNNSDF
jgi:hypothetical protein